MRHKQYAGYSGLAGGATLVGAQVGAKMSLSQFVAVLIKTWDELGDAVKSRNCGVA